MKKWAIGIFMLLTASSLLLVGRPGRVFSRDDSPAQAEAEAVAFWNCAYPAFFATRENSLFAQINTSLDRFRFQKPRSCDMVGLCGTGCRLQPLRVIAS